MRYDIAYDTKNKIEDTVIKLVNEYKEIPFVECITISSFYDRFSGKPTIGLTLICDTLDNCNKLIDEVTFVKVIDNITITLGYTYRFDLLEDRKKFFKNEHILVDKKDYKNMQKSIRNYNFGFDNMIEFNPKLKLK